MVPRRSLLLASLTLPLAMPPVRAQQRRSLADPLRLGADAAVFDSGLARALQQAFGRDTGVVVQVDRRQALPMLEALERGELDAALSNVPEAEARLEAQGLVHDRRAIADSAFVIVGPAPRGKVRDPAGLAGGHDAAAALVRVRDAAVATPGALRFLSANDGSGTHAAEQALWRAAGIAPAAPWYVQADKTRGLLLQARELDAYALIERGVWLAHGGGPLAVLVEGDPRLIASVHVMRSFRVSHPAGKMFVEWIAGSRGRRVVARHPGYRSPAT
jgi:tungstate transport system substrate-binding protein